jgi:hypothetical protein
LIWRFGRDARTAAGSARDRAAAEAALLDLVGGLAFELGRLLPNRRGFTRNHSGYGNEIAKLED